MRLRRFARCSLLVAAVALLAALPVSGKEGARATLTTRVPIDATAGTTFRISWVVTVLDGGRRRPFGASGMFVRLLSPVRRASTKVYARSVRGRYQATVTVPRGGLRGMQLGLRSWVSGPSGTREIDWLLPITNNPFRTRKAVTSP